MKILLVILASFLGFLGADHKEKEAIKVVEEAKIQAKNDSIAELKMELRAVENTPTPTVSKLATDYCDSAKYFNEGIKEGLKLCPKPIVKENTKYIDSCKFKPLLQTGQPNLISDTSFDIPTTYGLLFVIHKHSKVGPIHVKP